jgi:hypothetical protein
MHIAANLLNTTNAARHFFILTMSTGAQLPEKTLQVRKIVLLPLATQTTAAFRDYSRTNESLL